MFQETIPQISQEKIVLSEIIEYILDQNNTQLKVIEILNMTYNDKNIFMILLEKHDLYNIKRLFEISHIIFTHQEILMYKDISGIDLLGYFIEYATYDLIDEFIRMLLKYTSKEDQKTLLSNVDKQGRTHLMMICGNKKFENLESTVKHFIDLIASSCGLDYLHAMLVMLDNNYNNILMIALKNNNDKITLKILDIISKTVIDNDERIKIEYHLMTQRDLNGRNILMLLSEMRTAKQIQSQIIKIIQEIPSNWLCLMEDRSQGHNMITSAIINNNEDMIDNVFSILATMNESGQKIIFTALCKNFDSNNDNYISLCFKYLRSDIYMDLIEKIENIVEIQLIIQCFQQTFMAHKNILHLVLLDNNIEATLSIIKYLRLVNNVSEDDKRYISELMIRNNSSLLAYAIKGSNHEIFEMILNLAQEFCDSIVLKMLINFKDINGNTPYMLARFNNNKKLIALLMKFAEKNGNQELIFRQIKDFDKIYKLKNSHIMPLVTRVFT